MTHTVLDCYLNGVPLAKDELASLSSEDIAAIVGFQMPGDALEDTSDYAWSFEMLPLDLLRFSNEDGEEPEGGWKAAYLRHQESDREAVANGSIEYEGRAEWLAEWSRDTSIYPLYIVTEDDGYRLLDGYHRLAGAFWHGVEKVAVFLGSPKPTFDASFRKM